MKPVSFKEANKTLTKPESMTDEECGSLPVYNDGETSISCWEFNDDEIAKLRITKKLWAQVFSGETSPPIGFSVDNPFIKEEDKAPENDLVPEAMEIFKKLSDTADDLIVLSYLMGWQNRSLENLKIGSEEWAAGVEELYRKSVYVRNAQKKILSIFAAECLVEEDDIPVKENKED